MKKITLLVLFLSTLWGYSQVKSYTFSQTTGTYNEITGGVLLGNASLDVQKFIDPAYPNGGGAQAGVGLPIGFDFVFNGMSYDKFGIATDGWISLGTSNLEQKAVDMTVNDNRYPLSATYSVAEGLAARIAALAMDLQGQPGCSIRYEVSGAAPNKVLTVQWSKFRKYNSTTDSFNFQIKLYQTSNKVEIIYGPFTIDSNSNNRSAQVGLRSDPSTVTSSFLNRTSSTDWSATAPGTSATDNISLTVKPNSGLTFAWAPATCGGPKDFAVSNLTANSATLNWNFSIPTPTSSEYIISTSANVPIGSGTPSPKGALSLTSLAGNTNYYVFVRSTCGTDISQWNLAGTFRTKCDAMDSFTENFDSYPPADAAGPGIMPYCWDTNDPGITKIVSKSDFPATAPNMLYMEASGSTVIPYAILPKMTGLQDGNHRLKFKAFANVTGAKLDVGYFTDRADLGSFVILESVDLPSTVSSALEFLIFPKSVPAGVQYLAFRIEDKSEKGSTIGYVDDVVWGPIPSCADIKSLTVEGILSSSAVLKWTPTGSEKSWQYAYGPSTVTDPSTLSAVDVSSTTATITGLSPLTSYRVWVRAKCGSSYGEWIVPVGFKTTCVPATLISQNFDANTNFPNCWKKVSTAGTAAPKATTGAPSGANTLFMDAGSVVVMEPVSNYNTGTHRLKFNVLGSSVGTAVEVGYLKDFYNADSFQSLSTYTVSSNTVYEQASANLGATPTTPYLAFKVSFGTVNIDDVSWEPNPSCPDVITPTVSLVKNTSVNLRWKTSGIENQWQYAIAPAATADSSNLTASDFTSAPNVVGTAVSASITGLTTATAYKIWLRSKCGVSNVGAWIGPLVISTTCDPVPAFTQNFDANTNIPSCWSKVGSTGTITIAAIGGSLTPPSVPNTMYLSGSSISSRAMVALPAVSTSASGTHRLRFQARGSVENTVIEVGYMTNLADPASFTSLRSITIPSATAYNTFTADLGFEPASQVLALRNSASPAGTIFIDNVAWEPLPTCDDILGLQLNMVGSTSVDLSWTTSEDVSKWQYAVGVSTLTAPPAPVDTNSSTITVNELAPSTTYKIWVRSKCGSDSGIWTDPLTFTTNCATVTDFAQNFDSSASLPGCWTIVGNGGTASVTSAAAPSSPNVLSVGGFSATSQGIVAMQPVSNIADGNHRLRFKFRGVVDYANLEVGFLPIVKDPTSFVSLATFTASSTSAYDHTKIVVPADPKMQVLAFRNPGTPISTVYIDDVFWEPIPACMDISSVAVNGTNSTSTKLSWITDTEVGFGVTYQYVIGASTETDPSKLIKVDVTSTSTTVNDLLPGTSYKVWVRTKCSDTAFGLWSEPLTFMTTCAPVSEFTQKFDANLDIPACWREVGSSNGLSVFAKAGASAPNTLVLDGSNKKITVAMPAVNNISDGTHRLKFKFSSTVANATLEVGYMTDINDAATFQPLQTYKSSAANIFESKIALLGTNPVPGSTLAFRNPAAPASYIYIDDVIWETKPACADVANVTAKLATPSSVQLSWDAIGTEQAWQYAIVPYSATVDPDALPASKIIDTALKSLPIQGLIPNNVYKIWVRSNCGNGVYGAWGESKIFMTPCSSTATIDENFDADKITPDCWRQLTSNGIVKVVSGKGSLGTNAMELMSDVVNDAVYVSVPPLSTAMTGGYNLKFTYKASNADTKVDVICYKDPNNLTDETSYTVLKSINIAIADKDYVFSEILAPTATPYLGLKVYNTTKTADVFIDNFVWEVPKPTACASEVTSTPDTKCGNNATNILWYSAPNALGYKLTIGTTSGGSDVMNKQDVGDVLSYLFAGKANTTYYFTVTPWNASGDAAGCDVYSFTTAAENCYCASVPFSNDGKGITSVTIGTATFENGDVMYKNYSAQPVNVVRGASADLSISFDTSTFGYYTNIWIDFNDDFIFDPSELVYSDQANVATGDNPSNLQGGLMIPATAAVGKHGMRLVATRNWSSDPCSFASGVTLDFKVNVLESDDVMGTDVFQMNNFTLYPNPVKDVLNMSMNQEITNVTVSNILGQQVINKSVNAENVRLDLSDLSNGVYLVKVISGNQSKVIKVIKD